MNYYPTFVDEKQHDKPLPRDAEQDFKSQQDYLTLVSDHVSGFTAAKKLLKQQKLEA